jgi:glutamate-1-semialdehyde 2,1-aminomutase
LRSPLPAASTFSKDSRLFGVGFLPDHIDRAEGATVYADGQAYTDWISSLGSVLLGHGHPEFCERVARQLRDGTNYSMPSRLERIVADKLVAILGTRVPGWKPDDLGVRFVLSGSGACETIIRQARAYTGRRWCLVSGYHGYHGLFTGLTPPARGVEPDPYITTFPYGDLAALECLLTEYAPVAVVFLEVLPQSVSPDYWTGLRALCDRYGCLLAVDEVVTGWRFAIGGACEVYGIRPDLCAYAKAIANGVPFGAVVGRRDLFDVFDFPSPVFISGTALGSPIGLAAVDAMLDLWHDEDVAHVWEIGRQLVRGLTDLGYDIIGQRPRFLVQFASEAERAYTIVRMRDHGILWNRPVLPARPHTREDVEFTIRAAETIRKEIDAGAKLPDRLPLVLFRGR